MGRLVGRLSLFVILAVAFAAGCSDAGGRDVHVGSAPAGGASEEGASSTLPPDVPRCPPARPDPVTGEQASGVVGGALSYPETVVGAPTAENALEEFRVSENARQRDFDDEARAHGQPRAEPARRERVEYQRSERLNEPHHVRFVGRDSSGVPRVAVDVADHGSDGKPRWLVEGYLVCAQYLDKGGEL